MKLPRKLKKTMKGKKYKNANVKLLYDIVEQQLRKEFTNSFYKFQEENITKTFLPK